jgi:hypothetical protein
VRKAVAQVSLMEAAAGGLWQQPAPGAPQGAGRGDSAADVSGAGRAAGLPAPGPDQGAVAPTTVVDALNAQLEQRRLSIKAEPAHRHEPATSRADRRLDAFRHGATR